MCYHRTWIFDCPNRLSVNNQSARYISFVGDVVDLQKIWLMRNVNVSFVENIEFKITNNESLLSLKWS